MKQFAFDLIASVALSTLFFYAIGAFDQQPDPCVETYHAQVAECHTDSECEQVATDLFDCINN